MKGLDNTFSLQFATKAFPVGSCGPILAINCIKMPREEEFVSVGAEDSLRLLWTPKKSNLRLLHSQIHLEAFLGVSMLSNSVEKGQEHIGHIS